MNKDKLQLLKSKVSPAQLAEFVGKSRPYISSVLNGSLTPSNDLAQQLATACNIFCQRQGYFSILDFLPEAETNINDQRIALLEVEIAQRIHMIDEIRRESDPTAKGMLDVFSAFHRICTIVEGLKG